MNTTELLSNEEATKAVKDLMHEVIMIAGAEGYDYDEEQQVKTMLARTEETALNYKPSM